VKRATEARKKWGAAVDTLAEANVELGKALSVASYINQQAAENDGGHRRRSYSETPRTVPNPTRPRERIAVDMVLTSLRTLAEPAEPIKPGATVTQMRAA